MDKQIQARLRWVELYEETGDAGLVCRRCGISRPTLRKWLRRYQESGLQGLADLSKRPLTSPQRKVWQTEEKLVLELRKTRKMGARRLQSELQRLHEIELSLATIHKVLTRNNTTPLIKVRKKTDYIRYSRPLPGDRIQIDTCKIASGLYQYTAIDDCTRYRVLGLFARRTAANTLLFLDQLTEEMPFPIQRIQTDRGLEFFAEDVQRKLMKLSIKFRPNKPGSPHLNGKVERSQKTDRQEFYSTVNLGDPKLKDLLAEWQHYYNWERPHGAHKGKTPMEKYFLLSDKTPFLDDVRALYTPSNERIQNQNYKADLRLWKLKGSL